jgi:hypothetical protein
MVTVMTNKELHGALLNGHEEQQGVAWCFIGWPWVESIMQHHAASWAFGLNE